MILMTLQRIFARVACALINRETVGKKEFHTCLVLSVTGVRLLVKVI